MLHRIPAVKWAFTRLRPLPRSSSIDDAVRAAEGSIVADIAETAPARDSTIRTNPSHRDADIEVASEPLDAPELVISRDPPAKLTMNVEPFVLNETPVSSVEAEGALGDTPELIGSDRPAELLASVESFVVEEPPVSSVEVESAPIDIPEPVVDSTPSPELPADVGPAVAEEAPASLIEIDVARVDAPVLVVHDDPAVEIVGDVEPVVADDLCIALADTEVSAIEALEGSVDSASAPSVAAEIEPIPVNDPVPVAANAAEPVPATAAPKISTAPKARAKIVEPADRATLIRQRWAETGIRMWNPRLHGTGDATLNIQGRIELLPPESGETMPRYDKLEFKMLGGQIVCEGVIVEAPVSAGQRSFTRLAEPLRAAREPVRERQAALA
ncbi:hypothetical protein [Bradyrhizobium sp. 930_D9_N1_4]|uniref:hypothetical protein n=1 Tax=Bradyrhizobium sp. 930_D9_N1_4 TaxID=3240374 RepID=UPI003F8C29D7